MKLGKRERIEEGGRTVRIVQELKRSGMSTKEVCAEVGLDTDMYYYLTR